jgi:hypothetical protein
MRPQIAQIIALLLISTAFSFSKKFPVIPDEVVIGISNLQADGVEGLKKKFKLVAGITFEGYCENENCIAITVDRALHPDDKSITDIILEVNPDFKLYYKYGMSFSDLATLCPDKEKLFAK